MTQHFTNTLVTAIVVLTIAVFSFIFMPFALVMLVVGGPALWNHIKRRADKFMRSSQSAVTKTWSKLPQRAYLESVTESCLAPVLISHRESTEIVYANSIAQQVLGDSLIGRTVESEGDLQYKPIYANGEEINKENHPANLLKLNQGKIKADVVWATPRGNLKFKIHGQRLNLESHDDSDNFFIMTLHASA